MDLLYFICAKLVGVENLKACFMNETSLNRGTLCLKLLLRDFCSRDVIVSWGKF